MKISKIEFKNKTGKNILINLTKQDGNPYNEFFIYGDHNCGKTYLAKLISDAWQMNLFHGENGILKSATDRYINIEANFSDLQPIIFGIPSKLTNKVSIQAKISIEKTIKNSILYYPAERYSVVDDLFFYGEIATNAAIPLADLHDSTIQNCCLVIDNCCRGLSETESQEYVKMLVSSAQKNNNQIIMFMDTKNANLFSSSSRTFRMDEESQNSVIDICMEFINKTKNKTT